MVLKELGQHFLAQKKLSQNLGVLEKLGEYFFVLRKLSRHFLVLKKAEMGKLVLYCNSKDTVFNRLFFETVEPEPTFRLFEGLSESGPMSGWYLTNPALVCSYLLAEPRWMKL